MQRTLSMSRDTGVLETEALLADLESQDVAGDDEIGIELFLPSQSGAILADAWLGIATGTVQPMWHGVLSDGSQCG